MNGPVSKAQAVVETATGVVLMGTPWWSHLIADVSQIATMIAAICGAIIGIAGVVTLIKRKRVNDQRVP